MGGCFLYEILNYNYFPVEPNPPAPRSVEYSFAKSSGVILTTSISGRLIFSKIN